MTQVHIHDDASREVNKRFLVSVGVLLGRICDVDQEVSPEKKVELKELFGSWSENASEIVEYYAGRDIITHPIRYSWKSYYYAEICVRIPPGQGGMSADIPKRGYSALRVSLNGDVFTLESMGSQSQDGRVRVEMQYDLIEKALPTLLESII